MKCFRIWAALALCCLFETLAAQQPAIFPRWDARSATWLSGRVGVGFQFSNQNRPLYFFTEADFCFSCAYNHFARPPRDLHEQLRRNRFRGNLHLKLQTIKDFKLYNTLFYKRSPDIQFKNLSWTYFTLVGLSADVGLYRPGHVADLENGGLTDVFRQRSRVRLRYDVVSRYHSYYYRKLSNTVGYITLNVAALDDRWGVNFNWGNDVFILRRLRDFLTNHDHGETNSIYLTAYVRPNERSFMDANMAFDYRLQDVEKIEFGASLRMITDRRTAKRTTTNQARSGNYDVLGLKNSFHGYYGLRLRVETGFYGVGGLFGKDDLQWGRNMQRFAHQGYAHLPKNFAQRIFIKAFKGVHSPLFPWESQPLYYQKPRFYYELNTDVYYPVSQEK